MHCSTNQSLKSHHRLLLVVLSCLLFACEQPAKQYDYSIFAFGTLIDISLYDVDKKKADKAFVLLQNDFDQYHLNWSPWTNGDLAKTNALLNKQKAAPLAPHLIPLITESMELSRQSNNYFNPTIGKLINLWQFHRYQENDIHPPEPAEIQSLLAQNPKLSDLTISTGGELLSNNKGVSLSFGAFAKGYAIALSIKKLQQIGIKNAVINAGGDLSVIGQHGDRAWSIGIRHPREDKVLASVAANSNESIFTSGDYERYYDYQGKRYHHILDPRTGYPTDDAQSVTVIDSNAGRADAAATALFVAGSKNWQAIAKRMNIHFVMLIDANGDIHMTPAMEKRIKFLNKSPTSRIIVSQEL